VFREIERSQSSRTAIAQLARFQISVIGIGHFAFRFSDGPLLTAT
jgi:hypothetical protein